MRHPSFETTLGDCYLDSRFPTTINSTNLQLRSEHRHPLLLQCLLSSGFIGPFFFFFLPPHANTTYHLVRGKELSLPEAIKSLKLDYS
jgi:hypothetical protein